VPPSEPVSVSVPATGAARPTRRAKAKYQRARPSDAEHQRRQEWGTRQGQLNRDAISQAMEAMS
jgi:hypothetical protein